MSKLGFTFKNGTFKTHESTGEVIKVNAGHIGASDESVETHVYKTEVLGGKYRTPQEIANELLQNSKSLDSLRKYAKEVAAQKESAIKNNDARGRK